MFTSSAQFGNIPSRYNRNVLLSRWYGSYRTIIAILYVDFHYKLKLLGTYKRLKRRGNSIHKASDMTSCSHGIESYLLHYRHEPIPNQAFSLELKKMCLINEPHTLPLS